MSSVHVICGPEPLRRNVVAHITRQTVETGKTRTVANSEKEATEALTSLSWTSTLVHIKDYDQYTTAEHAILKQALEATSHDVIIEAEKLTKAQEKTLPSRSSIRKIASSGQGYRQALAECANLQQVQIDPGAIDYLTRNATPSAAVSAITALSSAQINPIKVAHVTAIARGEGNSGLPWLLLDAIDSHDNKAIQEHSEAVETPAFTAYLAKRLVAAALLKENAQADIPASLSGISDAALRQASQWANTYTIEELMRAISTCANADRLAKSGNTSEALALALSGYSKLRSSRNRQEHQADSNTTVLAN